MDGDSNKKWPDIDLNASSELMSRTELCRTVMMENLNESNNIKKSGLIEAWKEPET